MTVAIRPLSRREYRAAVAVWTEMINTFPEHRDNTVAMEVLAALTVAICAYEEASFVRRAWRRLAWRGGLPLRHILDCYPPTAAME